MTIINSSDANKNFLNDNDRLAWCNYVLFYQVFHGKDEDNDKALLRTPEYIKVMPFSELHKKCMQTASANMFLPISYASEPRAVIVSSIDESAARYVDSTFVSEEISELSEFCDRVSKRDQIKRMVDILNRRTVKSK